MTLYGILDDFGDVIRWQEYKPSAEYKYVTKRVPKVKKEVWKVDWNNFEEALV